MGHDSPLNPSLEEQIATRAHTLGFDAIGFCDATLGPETETGLRAFIAENRHGTMHWMEERIPQRVQPRTLWPETRSVISLGLSYAPATNPLTSPARSECGTISVYARHRDYHDILKGMMKHLAQFVVSKGGEGTQVKVFVDTAPVAERDLAAKAHLGWRGKHGCLVSRTHGSWLFLGEIFTSVALTPSPPRGGSCGSCTRCLTICPTNAFLGPGRMDARRCISYLTIEHKGPIPHDLRPLMGNHIYGCDDCIAICPWNRFASPVTLPKLQAKPENMAPLLAELVQLDDAGFRQRFSGSPIKRIRRNRFVRNVLIAIGNAGQADLIPHAQRLCQDPDPDIAETARWAIATLEHHP